jgi:uncharacterized protein
MQDWVKERLPTRERLLASRWIRPFADHLSHPSLWHLNRRSLARGVALGLFAGFLVPLGQTPAAAAAALPARANVIVAAVATTVTNPLTFAPIYFAAHRVGKTLMGEFLALDDGALWLARWLYGVIAPTALGLLLFGAGSALAGYYVARLLWRWRVVHRWRRRGCATGGRRHVGRPRDHAAS